MAGHSHWASIKHKKGAADAKKGKAFSKIARMITVAARRGGGNPEMNPRLQLAISKARAVNMPKDNIERAIQKGTGEGSAEAELFECMYEGYGPSGVALMVEIVTDNKNRTPPEIRKIFERFGGNMGESGCVSWMFEKKGLIIINSDTLNEDDLMMLALEAGAEDMQKVGDAFQVICSQADLYNIKVAIENKNITVQTAELSWIPKNSVDLDETAGRKVLGLMEALEEHDDVQNVYSNFNLPQSLLAEMQSSK
ncbi:MAG: YebC/PmpR family DNA-binding transcriptional regulator [Candidatus Jettenia sp.]|uniref:Probable transcriptional regulatory protein KSU1_D0815 n=1 Tax=Candidatus Jettenia caeni TaxID=247490 RepID=I3IQX9_9BACT|nr:YebC/PmpR family DNA-binding transcriptional regulator [Candidatus Jettenia sp. AMX1]MBC6929583.1 YebC/PmpR family DNA-binding transcriptional regulator [Candidatus Jettenia sp.]NUN21923.1 YebC/PmpR family DNA-binding transcriptional regulator [Candidatus Jettenia caeni]KAA0247974.1 MAG: YebC/PmpR family DNA-binding transcriptional regulator [Candidatus Jettenia sp. AMX1]MCE7879703.1 YebC/PmpR family DNA-binding transcriptional regulator [Candidatus Jettenia sp. AMX1]MCQ3927744.1 YebC/PmpR 